MDLPKNTELAANHLPPIVADVRKGLSCPTIPSVAPSPAPTIPAEYFSSIGHCAHSRSKIKASRGGSRLTACGHGDANEQRSRLVLEPGSGRSIILNLSRGPSHGLCSCTCHLAGLPAPRALCGMLDTRCWNFMLQC